MLNNVLPSFETTKIKNDLVFYYLLPFLCFLAERIRKQRDPRNSNVGNELYGKHSDSDTTDHRG